MRMTLSVLLLIIFGANVAILQRYDGSFLDVI